jgi:hypothetical protein
MMRYEGRLEGLRKKEPTEGKKFNELFFIDRKNDGSIERIVIRDYQQKPLKIGDFLRLSFDVAQTEFKGKTYVSFRAVDGSIDAETIKKDMKV